MAVGAHNAPTACYTKSGALPSNFLGVTPAPQYSLNLATNKVTVKRPKAKTLIPEFEAVLRDVELR